MDIKSRSFKYSYFTKTIAVMFAFALVFISGYSVFSLYRSEVIFADDGKDNPSSTPSFLYNISKDLNNIYVYCTTDRALVENMNVFAANDDISQNSIKAFNSDRELAITLFDIIQSFKSLAPENKSSNGAYENEDYSEHSNSGKEYILQSADFYTNSYDDSAATPIFVNPSWSTVSALNSNGNGYYLATEYTASRLDISEVKKFLDREYTDYDEWYNDYQVLRSYIFALVDDASSHGTINIAFDEKTNELISSNWDSYRSEFNYCKERITTMVNIRFAVQNRKTGEIFTNIEDKDFNLEQFKSSLGDSLFHINYSGKKGLISGGIPKGSEATNTIVGFFGYTSGSPMLDSFNNSRLESYFSDEYDAYIMIPKELQRGDVYHYIYQNYHDINEKHILSLSTSALILLLSVIPTVYLIIVSGRKSDDSISIAPVDKIPFVIHLTLSVGITLCLLAFIAVLVSFEFNNSFYSSSLYVILSIVYSAVPVAVGLLLGIMYLVMLEVTLSFARLVKTKQFFRNTLLYYIIRVVKFFIRLIALPFTKTVKRTMTFGIIAFLLVNGFTALIIGSLLNNGTAGSIVFVFFLWLILNAAVFYGTIKYVSGLNTISLVAQEMKSGNYNVPLNINALPKPLRKTAENIIDVRSSIQLAVDEQLKGERMKTELITNVSHDLKTPLTSIINYVDLLKKCNIEDEDATKYLEVLDEKSKRLKRLIDDLTEASKASTGNIKMNLEPINLSELTLQALGEHSDTLEASGLNAVYKTSETHPIVYADSQHTWRIIDNLFSNAKKYAQADTRVYIDVYVADEYGVFSMKNTSKNPLNIPVSELTERFVRGDAARTGEGSGLGLSIAQNLCELQGGKFILEIDGDLFKASIKLPLYSENN